MDILTRVASSPDAVLMYLIVLAFAVALVIRFGEPLWGRTKTRWDRRKPT
jgi:hypothetical protein